MKLASGVAASSMTATATTTAMTMIGTCVRHADRGDDAVDGEYEVEHEDLADARPRIPSCGFAVLEQVGAGIRVDAMVDLLGRLPDQEQAAGDQDQVAPREAVADG